MKILILCAHPDDEVLGMGGTIKKMSKKHTIQLCVVSEGSTAQYPDKKSKDERKKACINAGKVLGISKIDFLDFPDMKLDTIPHLEINRALEKIISKFNPKIIFTTPENDLNKDHQIVHQSSLVVSRPLSSGVKKLISYEIIGHVKYPFHPNYYEDVTKELKFKIKALKCYKSEVNRFPHPRSIEVIESYAKIRGMESGLKNAEAFKIIRTISD